MDALQFVQLNNVPIDSLRFFANQQGISITSLRKEDIWQEISDKKPELATELYHEYQFAGRTAVDWYLEKPLPGSPSSVPRTSDEIWNQIIAMYSSDIMYLGRTRPPLESNPQLVYAERITVNGKILVAMMFAYNGPPRRFLVDYEPRFDVPTYFDYVVIRPGDTLIVEVRGNAKMSQRLVGAALRILDLTTDDFERIQLSGEEMCNSLVPLLDAKIQTARHKSPVGDYDYIEVMADPDVGDLAKSERYQTDLANSPSRRKILTFSFTYSFGMEEIATIEINTESGNIWFRSAVGEQVIAHVLGKVLIARQAIRGDLGG